MTRQGFGRNGKFKIANPEVLDARLKRVGNGIIQSSLDEFLARKIPFQMGGMSDPFSPIENKKQVSKKLIEVLNKYSYPFIISTKSKLVSTPAYINLLAKANCVVRFSTTVVDQKYRALIDLGCSSFSEICDSASDLSREGVPVSFRFQPVIPGFEQHAFSMLREAKSSGARHVSVEFLKVPIDANQKFGKVLIRLFQEDPIGWYRSMGARKQGREYILPLNYRHDFLVAFYSLAKRLSINIGFADNDLLLHSDGGTCCSGSDIFLKKTAFFEANIVAYAKKKKVGENLIYSDLIKVWFPERSIDRHLNSTARVNSGSPDRHASWPDYLRKMWNGEWGVYSPNFFDGVALSDGVCKEGLPIYRREATEFSRALELNDQGIS